MTWVAGRAPIGILGPATECPKYYFYYCRFSLFLKLLDIDRFILFLRFISAEAVPGPVPGFDCATIAYSGGAFILFF